MMLGNMVRKWRLMSDLTLSEAARLMNLDTSTLSRMESGKPPSAETLRSLLFFALSPNKSDLARRSEDRRGARSV